MLIHMMTILNKTSIAQEGGRFDKTILVIQAIPLLDYLAMRLVLLGEYKK